MVSLGNDCCNLGGSRNNLMKQIILYFFIREQCHRIYYGQCDKPPRKLLRCWWANDSNFHHKSGQITKGSPPWLSSTSPRTSKNSCATLQYPITIQSLLFLLKLQVYRQGLLCTCTQCLNKCKTFTFTDNLNFYIYN